MSARICRYTQRRLLQHWATSQVRIASRVDEYLAPNSRNLRSRSVVHVYVQTRTYTHTSIIYI